MYNPTKHPLQTRLCPLYLRTPGLVTEIHFLHKMHSSGRRVRHFLPPPLRLEEVTAPPPPGPRPIHPAHTGAPRSQGLHLIAFVFTPSLALAECPAWAGTVVRGLSFSVTGGRRSGARGQEQELRGGSLLVKCQGSEGHLPREHLPQSRFSPLLGTICWGPLRCTHIPVEAQSWVLQPASGCGFLDTRC